MAVNHSAVSSPWNQIVAAAATAAAPPPSSSPPPSAAVVHTSIVNSAPVDDSDNAAGGQNVNTVKRQVWNKPSNAASSSVMGAESWPALSESARSPAKSPLESVKAVTDSATLPSLQGTGSLLPSPQRQVRENATANNVAPGPTHQKPFRRGNSNLLSNGGHPPQMSAPQGSMVVPPGPHSHNHTPKDNPPRAGFVPNDHQQHRNSFRNRNGGPHQRGDGSHHHNYGGRRDQDRANQDWNTHRRNFNGRDNYMSPRFVPQFIRPPLPSPGQLYPPPPPPPIRSFGGSMGYHELAPPMLYIPPPMESLRGVPFVPPPMPPNAMYFQPQDLQLHTKIVNQIDYYFSNENLIKDIYLRKNMDDQGWVPLNLIAGFKKVKQMTDNFQIVSDAVRTSSVVEMQGDKIRRWNDWKKWIMPSTQLPNVAGSQNIGQLAEKVQSIALEATKNGAAGGLDVSQIRPPSDSNNKYLISTGENAGQIGIQVSD